jgi:hypothetical protein
MPLIGRVLAVDQLFGVTGYISACHAAGFLAW